MPAAVSQMDRPETSQSEDEQSDSMKIKELSGLIGKRRRIGLDNIGNTCYMNATIQAIRTVAPFTSYLSSDAIINRLRELDRDERSAPVSFALANLFREMERTKYSAIEPVKFAKVFSLACPQFEPYQQHDAHECVLRLLDCIHEELQPKLVGSKVNNSNGPSIVSALFKGEFSSTVQCTKCQTVSKTIEPFYGVSIPICSTASRATRSLTIDFVSYRTELAADGSKLEVTVEITPLPLVLRATMRRATHILHEVFRNLRQTNGSGAKISCVSQLVLVSVDNRGHVTWYEPAAELDDATRYVVLCVPNVSLSVDENDQNQSVGVSFPVGDVLKAASHTVEFRVAQCLVQPAGFRADRCSFCDASESEVELASCSKCRSAAYCLNSDCQKNDIEKHRNVCFEQADSVGLPFALRVALPSRYTAAVGRTLNDILERFAFASTSVSNIDSRSKRLFKPVQVNLDGSSCRNQRACVSRSVGDSAFRIVSMYASENGGSCNVPIVPMTETPKVSVSLVIWWQNRLYTDLSVTNTPCADLVWKRPKLDNNAIDSSSYRRSSDVVLSDCLDAFVEEELLTESDAWNCPRCLVKRAAMKSIRFATLPDVLVIHLKRFRLGNIYRKLSQRVEYPMHQLDLARYCASADAGSTQYDLAAVIEHHGNSLVWGHYTAVCAEANSEGSCQWTRFDDSLVRPLQDSNVSAACSDAYVLLYVRNRQSSLRFDHLSTASPAESSSPSSAAQPTSSSNGTATMETGPSADDSSISTPSPSLSPPDSPSSSSASSESSSPLPQSATMAPMFGGKPRINRALNVKARSSFSDDEGNTDLNQLD